MYVAYTSNVLYRTTLQDTYRVPPVECKASVLRVIPFAVLKIKVLVFLNCIKPRLTLISILKSAINVKFK